MKGNTYKLGLPPSNKFHVVNEEFFKEINSELSAYWFGMLMADGSMKYDKSGYGVGMGLIDKEHIEQFLKDIESDAKIGIDNHNKKPWYFVRINGKQFCTHLFEKGMVPNKTKILQFPTCVPDELMNHFIRGYWDGDGSIMPGKNGFSTQVVGTFSFVSKLSEILKQKCNLQSVRVYLHSNQLYKFTKGSRQAEKVCDYLYKDASRFLERKHDKYLIHKENLWHNTESAPSP